MVGPHRDHRLEAPCLRYRDHCKAECAHLPIQRGQKVTRCGGPAELASVAPKKMGTPRRWAEAKIARAPGESAWSLCKLATNAP
jgi:hypothetical protein